jgi:hypothetical protein
MTPSDTAQLVLLLLLLLLLLLCCCCYCCPAAALLLLLSGEVGLFEMKGGGLSAVKDAAALFLPSTAAAAEAAQDSSSSSSSELVGTAIGVVLDGIRPLPLEIQALATPRLLDNPASSAAGNDAVDGDVSDMLGSDVSGADGFTADDDGLLEEDDEEGSGFSGLSSNDGDDGDELEFDGQVTRSRGRDRLDVSGKSRELAPLYRHYVGLADKPRMAMLLELLSKYTPIKVRGGGEGLSNLLQLHCFVLVSSGLQKLVCWVTLQLGAWQVFLVLL